LSPFSIKSNRLTRHVFPVSFPLEVAISGTGYSASNNEESFFF